MPKGDGNLDDWLHEVSNLREVPKSRNDPVAQNSDGTSVSSSSSSLLVAIIALVLVTGEAIAGYAFRQESAVKQLASQKADLSATISQLRGQLNVLTAKLNAMSAAQLPPIDVQPAIETVSEAAPVRPAAAKRHTASPSDTGYKQLEDRANAQQKEFENMQDSVAQTRADLSTRFSSAKDQMTASIAKTHEELVALEKRGDRDYFEFGLTKGKDFERTGPISVSLRHTDTKHMSYDAVVLIDDNRLTKKHVDLYEPVWFDRADKSQPLELVVNKVDKNHVHGYLSAPSNRNSQLAANNTSSAPQTASPGFPPLVIPSSIGGAVQNNAAPANHNGAALLEK